MKLLNRSALAIHAKAPFADWVLQLPADEDASLGPVSRESLLAEGNVYLIDEVEDEADLTAAIGQRWQTIFENELAAWDEFGDAWPSPLSAELFAEWFEVKPQLMTFDLADDTLLVAPLSDAL